VKYVERKKNESKHLLINTLTFFLLHFENSRKIATIQSGRINKQRNLIQGEGRKNIFHTYSNESTIPVVELTVREMRIRTR
jgi:hypothetical protein